MKKLLRTIIMLVLLVGVGFVYLVKNPELPISQKILSTIGIDMSSGKQAAIDPNCISYFDGCNTCMVSGGIIGGCTKMFCETPAEPQCLEYIRTGMDLSNCTSYFDGCNNCTVENGRPSACTLMYCETPAEPKCNEYASGDTARINIYNCKTYFDGCNTCSVKDGQPEACTEMYCETPAEPKCLKLNDEEDNGTVGMANPASTNCIDKGGTLNIVTSSDGGQVGMCTFSDGSVCEERAYMRGECKPGDNNQGSSVPSNPGEEEPTMCTMDAKQCPDGSYVGRSGPNCEFAPCPGN